MDFRISIDIAAQPDVVWTVMSDVERWHEWTASIQSIRLLDAGPLAVGSRALIRQPKFPPAMWTVTALEPGRGFVWRNGMPWLWVSARHSVEPLGSSSGAGAGAGPGTRVTLQLHYAGLLGPLLARMTAGITNRYLALEAEGLKRRSEERAGTRSPRQPFESAPASRETTWEG